MANSYMVEVDTGETDESGGVHWSSNSIRLPTEEQAYHYGRDLMVRWVLVLHYRVVESEDEPNYQWNDKLEAIK